VGETERFRALLTNSLTEFPDHPGLLASQARIDLMEGRIDEAVDRLSRAINADPFHAQAFYQRGLANRRLGKVAEAERDLARAAELQDLTAEMDRLNRKAGRNPADPDILCQLGRVSALLGKRELAASWYVASLACDPRHAGSRLGLKMLGRDDLLRHPSRRLPFSTRVAGN
jgi:tetratricopeptide (TPR) repeat protein